MFEALKKEAFGLHSTTTEISERVARLEREGVIRGYHADVDPSALGFGMEVIIGLQTEQGGHTVGELV